MTNFLEINRHKLLFALKVTSLIFTLIVLIIFTISVLTEHEYPDWMLFAGVLISASIILPIIITGLAYIEWLSKRRIRNKAYKRQPFDELDKIGFTVSYLYDKTKWHFTEVTKETVIDGYRIQCNIKRESANTIEFKAFVKHKEIEKFDTLAAKLEQEDIYFDFGGLVKRYSLKNTANLTIEQLKTDLTQFVQLLKREELEPDRA